MASSASQSQRSQELFDSVAYHRSSPDRQQRLRNYIQRHTNENVDVILTPKVQTAAVTPTSEAAILDEDQTEFEKREAKRLVENTDGDYLIYITTQPAELEKLSTITRQAHADQNKQFGLALHELLHILHTDVSGTTSAIRNEIDNEYQSKVHRLFNAIEDGAIEHSVFESDRWTPRAENRLITVRTAQSLTPEDVPSSVEFSLWDAIDTTVYERAIFDEEKIDVLRDQSDTRIQFRSEPEREIYERLYPTLENFIYTARSQPTSMERVEAVIDFWKSTLKPIFDRDDEEQQQDSKQSKEGDSEGEDQQTGTDTPNPPAPETPDDDSGDGEQDSESSTSHEQPDNDEDSSAEEEESGSDTDQTDPQNSEPDGDTTPSDSHDEPEQSGPQNADSAGSDGSGSPLDELPDDVDLGDISADSETDQTHAQVGQPVEEMPDMGTDEPVSPPQDEDKSADKDVSESRDGSNSEDESNNRDEYKNIDNSKNVDESENEDGSENIPESRDGDDNTPSQPQDQATLGDFNTPDSSSEEPSSSDSDVSADPSGTDSETSTDSAEEDQSNTKPSQNPGEEPDSDSADGHESKPEPAIPDSGMDEDVAEDVESEIANEEASSGPDEHDVDRELDEIDRSLQQSNDAGPGSLEELLDGSEPTQTVSNKRWNRIRSEAENVGHQLKKALEKSSHDSKRSGLTSGSLDRRKLGQLGMGDPHAFTIDLPGDDKEYDIVFVIDGSGSMAGNEMYTATEAVARMSLAAEDLGVNVAITRFRSERAELVKPFSVDTEYVRDRVLDPYAQGGTPLADALALARKLLENQQQSGHRPLIITMTDGLPDDVDAVREEIKKSAAPVQSLTIATARSPSNPPAKAESLEPYWAGHTYLFDESNLDRRLDDFIARLAGV